jgi:alkyldihydroxyacetonephosphate synthase
MGNPTQRRSFWGWGLEADEPTDADRAKLAGTLASRWGVTVDPAPIPSIDDVELRPPRISAPDAIAGCCSTDTHARAMHSYGMAFTDRIRAFNRDFPNPPDIVAYPADEAELAAVLEWCHDAGHRVVPWGGGSSVVYGVNPPEADGVVTIDLDRFDQVLEIDELSRAARIQAGVLGPALEDQLRPSGYTLRHFPQSFPWSTLGGWIATRSGGHYATNHTHIDDFVESVRMLTPTGWWESRRLPGSGAGPSPDRMVIGSEGTLGIITEAWIRIQARPRFRATAGVTFPSWEAGTDAVRTVAQAKLWPANLRILDPAEAEVAAGLDGTQSLLIIGFESSEVSQAGLVAAAVDLARAAGGVIDDEDVLVSDGGGEATGRGGAVGQWRNSFIAPDLNTSVSLGLVSDTFETSITWDRWPEFDATVRATMRKALDEVCGGGYLSCRFTHVYPDGPAPYYTFSGMGAQGSEMTQWAELKHASAEAVYEAGGTVTHHHAVGRMHRPQYDRQMPARFLDAYKAAKAAVDPGGILNPGVLIDP